jgi:ssDNA-binding Zn-finger/Zn-ribbon topoisomerase 1
VTALPIKRTCPDCGAELVLRTNRKTETDFYGCSDWPRCTFTMEIPAYEHMLRAGASQLPGFE